MKKNKKKGYTLIELTAVIGVLALVISLTVGVLLSVVRAYDKQRVIAEVQRNGDSAINLIEELARNASDINCVRYDGPGSVVGTSCDGSLPSEVPHALRIIDDSDTYYVGYGEDIISTGACQNLENGFIFLTQNSDLLQDSDLGDSVTRSAVNALEEVKITNDESNGGINVQSFTYDVIDNNDGTPVQLILTAQIRDSECGRSVWEGEVRTFQSFVTVRGSYF